MAIFFVNLKSFLGIIFQGGQNPNNEKYWASKNYWVCGGNYWVLTTFCQKYGEKWGAIIGWTTTIIGWVMPNYWVERKTQ